MSKPKPKRKLDFNQQAMKDAKLARAFNQKARKSLKRARDFDQQARQAVNAALKKRS